MESDKESPVDVGDGNTTPLLAEKANGHDKPSNNSELSEEGNGKIASKLNGDDGSDKLVAGDKIKIQANKDLAEVKFKLTDSQNGDAKIDIETVKVAFAGMGKQELMKFANDPFWIRIRWFLFIAFWFIWAAMLIGAIAIIVMAPKCSSPAPLKWFEQSPMYQVYVRSFKDGSEPQDGVGDLKGLLSKLDYIKDIGVKGVTISSILKTSNQISDDSIEDFQEIDSIFGSLGDFKAVITGIKSRGLNLVMSIILNHSSNKHQWFVESQKNEAPYTDYYIWAPSSGLGTDGSKTPPNNWLSISGGSAWEWSEARGEYYLHQFRKDQPDLNFRNPAVVEEFKAILEYWLDLGVSGFQFEKVQYMFEDANLKNESGTNKPGPIHDEYEFYSHTKTSNLPEVLEILAKFKQVVRNHTGSEGFVSITGSIPALSINEFFANQSSSVIDLPQNPNLFAQLTPGYSGEDIHRKILQWLDIMPNMTRPSWQLGDLSMSRIASRLSDGDIDGLNMVTMLLPGTPITFYGEELGMEDSATTDPQFKGKAPMQWSNTSNAGFSDASTIWTPVANNYETLNVQAELVDDESHLTVYKALIEARNSPSIMYGATDMSSTANGSVFTYARIKSGNPGYLVAFNTAQLPVVANLTVLPNIAGDLTVAIRSSNIKNPDMDVKSKWPADAVPLPPKGALVLTFVPKKAE